MMRDTFLVGLMRFFDATFEQQMIINNPPDTGDCEACRITNQVVYDHRNYSGSSIKNVSLIK